ncbi:hypothetical protein [Arthrobacter sp. 2MCAF14]|uniref:hypothetical protein n=1 Tax=Arthrobacter sp. 2MCAF14 TaxID=3232982 RepID=UPI003F8DDC21
MTLSLEEAVKAIGSFNTLDNLPDSIWEPVQDLADAALACFPEAQAAFWELMDSQEPFAPETEGSFNYIVDAHRLLLPAVEAVSYPLIAKNGDEDVVINMNTPLIVMLPQTQAMGVLQFAAESDPNGALTTDAEFDALLQMTESLLDRYPAAQDVTYAAQEMDLDYNYFAGAFESLVAAQSKALQNLTGSQDASVPLPLQPAMAA